MCRLPGRERNRKEDNGLGALNRLADLLPIGPLLPGDNLYRDQRIQLPSLLPVKCIRARATNRTGASMHRRLRARISYKVLSLTAARRR